MTLEMTPGTATAEVEQLLEKAYHKTLGQLLARLRAKMNVSAAEATLLEEHLRERNWLIHDLVRLHDHALRGPEPDFVHLLERIRDIGKRATHLQAEFGRLFIEWAKGQGLTEEQIDTGAAARLRAQWGGIK